MEWLDTFLVGLIVGFILSGIFWVWFGSWVEKNLRIPKSEAAKVLTIMTEEAVLKQEEVK